LDGEFAGLEGVCRGDSGGPALDESGQLLGALSRGSAGCESPVYTGVFAFQEWLVEQAERASQAGGTRLPEWAGGEPPEASISPDVGAKSTKQRPPEKDFASEGGCSQHTGPGSAWAWLWLVAAILLPRTRSAR
jgi:hypothetical protein